MSEYISLPAATEPGLSSNSRHEKACASPQHLVKKAVQDDPPAAPISDPSQEQKE